MIGGLHSGHVGYLLRLVAHGFGGPIFATEATGALLRLLLPDAAIFKTGKPLMRTRLATVGISPPCRSSPPKIPKPQ